MIRSDWMMIGFKSDEASDLSDYILMLFVEDRLRGEEKSDNGQMTVSRMSDPRPL